MALAAAQQALLQAQQVHESTLAEMQGGIEAERQQNAQTLTDMRICAAAERQADRMVFTSDSARQAFLRGAEDALTVDEDGAVQGIEQYTEDFLTSDPSAVLEAGETVPQIVSGGGRHAPTLTRAELQRMPYEERLRLKKRAPALYRELT